MTRDDCPGATHFCVAPFATDTKENEMTTEAFKIVVDPFDEDRVQVLSEYGTELLFSWLTQPEQAEQARKYVRDGAALLTSGVQPQAAPGEATCTLSESVRTVTALRLSRSFGGGAPNGRCGVGAQPGLCAFHLSAWIDWLELADWLLRLHVPGYPPKDAGTDGTR